ncbi:MAG: hypothetical protein M1817_004748 [Caeruleum heppii]|nr:MAG: hypothetical protein M1817_004748 [Caeruleum heppii]
MHAFEATHRGKDRSGKFKISATYTWDDVIREAKLAQEQYKKDGKGLGNLGRRILRWTGDHSPAIKPWIDLVPNDKALTTLCGGLKIMLAAIARMSERREQIFEVISKVQDTVEHVERYRELFRNDQVLRDRAVSLYFTILQMIRIMIESLVEKSKRDYVKAPFRGKLSDQTVDDAIRTHAEHLRSFKKRTIFLADKAIVDTQARLNRMEPILKETVRREDIEALQSSLEQNLVQVLIQVLKNAQWSKELGESIESNHKSLPDNHETSLPTLEITPAMSQEQLLSLLRVDINVLMHDLRVAQASQPDFDNRSQRQAQSLLQHPRFQAWLCSVTPGLLLVDGNCDTYALSRISPTSMTSALLVRVLQQNTSARVVYFFCGAHTKSDDDLQGPAGLVRSIIAQLLTLYDFDLGFVNSEVANEQLNRGDIGWLCSLLRKLLRRLPRMILFVVLDGFTFHESKRWMDPMHFVVSELQQAVYDARTNVTLKVSITNPCASRFIRSLVAPADQIFLPQGEGVEVNEGLFLGRMVQREHLTKPLYLSSRGTADESGDEGDYI